MLEQEEKMELARLISVVQHRLHHSHMRHAFAESNVDCPAITPQQVNMLLTVREHGCVTIKQLSQILLVKAPAVSVMVDKLVEAGVLTREENPADRREVLVRVSPDEEAKAQRIESTYLKLTADLLDKLGPDCARMWGELCKQIADVLAEEQKI